MRFTFIKYEVEAQENEPFKNFLALCTGKIYKYVSKSPIFRKNQIY